MLKATVSGSFRRHMVAVNDAVSELNERGVEVLSPADPRVVDQIGEFVFVASDRVRSIKVVEDRHLECILASDFLWLVAPDGYVGQSASMELGYAVAHGVPVFSLDVPGDGTLQKYVQTVPTVSMAVSFVKASRVATPDESFLVRPHQKIAEMHDRLDRLGGQFSRLPSLVRDAEGEEILRERESLASLLSPQARQRRRVIA
jgi:hypothetical protein